MIVEIIEVDVDIIGQGEQSMKVGSFLGLNFKWEKFNKKQRECLKMSGEIIVQCVIEREF